MFKCLNKAVTGGRTHDLLSLSCSMTQPDPKLYVAWWMLTFPVDTVYITNVLIYYRYPAKRGRAVKTINKQWCKYLHEFILQLNIVMSRLNT
jgi:hypothetical protein